VPQEGAIDLVTRVISVGEVAVVYAYTFAILWLQEWNKLLEDTLTGEKRDALQRSWDKLRGQPEQKMWMLYEVDTGSKTKTQEGCVCVCGILYVQSVLFPERSVSTALTSVCPHSGKAT
jgi:hypothetical protein